MSFPDASATVINRDGISLAVVVNAVNSARGIAFVAHGLHGFKEQLHITAFAQALNAAGYTTIRWDAANTIGESDGRMEAASATSYYQDLCDVIAWAQQQDWYQEPFILCGHSFGGLISICYAQNNPESVSALIPVSSVIAGELTCKTAWTAEQLADWQQSGFRTEESKSKPGVQKVLAWNFIDDLRTFDTRPVADRLTMPVLLIVGDQDFGASVENQRELFDRIPGDSKTLEIIPGSGHDFMTDDELATLFTLINSWVSALTPAQL